MSTTDTPPPSKRQKLEDDEMVEITENVKMEMAEDEVEPAAEVSHYVADEVDMEEVVKLREFQILDEVCDGDSDQDNSDSSEDLPVDEIDRMLDENLPDKFKGTPKPKDKPYITTKKIVLEEKGVNQFEILPLDWMLVRHNSGMPVYLHKTTRVCTLARPYFLGKGSARKHDVPLSAVPCLSYRRALEEEEKQKEIDKIIEQQIADGRNANNSQDVEMQADNQNKSNEDKNQLAIVISDARCPIASEDYEMNKNKINEDNQDNIDEDKNQLAIVISDARCLIASEDYEMNKNKINEDNQDNIDEDKNQLAIVISDARCLIASEDYEMNKNKINEDNQDNIDEDKNQLAIVISDARCPIASEDYEMNKNKINEDNQDNIDEDKNQLAIVISDARCLIASEDYEMNKNKINEDNQDNINEDKNQKVIVIADARCPIASEDHEMNKNERDKMSNGGICEEVNKDNLEKEENSSTNNDNDDICHVNIDIVKKEFDNDQNGTNNDNDAICLEVYRDMLKMEDNSVKTDTTNDNDNICLELNGDMLKKEYDSDKTDSNDVNSQQLKDNPIVNGLESNSASESVTVNCLSMTETTNKEESKSEAEVNTSGPRAVLLPDGELMAPPRVETVAQAQHLTCAQLNEYCSRLFSFKKIDIMSFKSWTDRRKYAKARKTMQYPILPKGTKLITIPNTGDNGTGGNSKNPKRDWVMNMNGCSYLSVFHEYVRLALHKQPTYHFQQLENASLPYQATVYIGDMQYGVGKGSSKKQAKAAAAKASIQILIPEMKDDSSTEAGEPDLSFFESIGIEDPRVAQFCQACAEPSPHAILRTCLSRNFGATDRHIRTEIKKLEYQKMELTMRVGKHTATVVCKNKKTAKQRASQAILQKLHPHVRSWGSLIRLYGAGSVKSGKQRKMEEQQITLLQDHATHNKPNYAVLNKLRTEMLRLRDRDKAVVPIGTLILPDTNLPTHSAANLDNVQL